MDHTYKINDIKENPDLLKQFTWRTKNIPIQCSNCEGYRLLNRRDVYNLIKRNGKLSFCSSQCKTTYSVKHYSTEVQCKNCGKSFLKQNKELCSNNFCGRSCAGTYNNTHKTKGTRVSKLEVFISQKLTEIFPGLEIHYNRKDAINSELDIYIPSLNLGIELNGIFHYEPIYGLEKLSQIQNNDTRKFQACLERSIELCIIDTSMIKYFKESTSLPVLKVIVDLIQFKLSS